MHKTSIIFIFLIIFSNIIVKAQKLSFEYDIDTPKVSNIGNYQILSFKNSYQIAKIGEPSLPYLSVKLLLPSGTVAKSISFKFLNKKSLKGKYSLLPMQNTRPLNYHSVNIFAKNKNAYKQQNYPQYKFSAVSTQFMNGYAFALAKYTPVRYNAAKGEIFFYSKVIVTLKLSCQKITKNFIENKNPQILKKISDFADNYKVKKSFSQQPFNIDDYEMLIITPDEYKNSFKDLINNHLKRGIRSKVVTLSQINSSAQGRDMPEKMRNYIIKQYKEYSILYVLLGGDADILPYRKLYCEALSDKKIYSDYIPADVYFSGLDGNWNTNRNNKWGEPGEADLLPDVAVARLPFSNATELQNIIHKIISYSYHPVTSTNELNKPLLAGEFLWNNPLTYGSEYLKLLIGCHNDNGYSTCGITPSKTISKMYNSNGLNWTGQDILDSMNNGHSFLYHVGHSNANFMMGLHTSDITSSNFSKLDGIQHNYALLYSHGCICGAFDTNCISETMVKIAKCAVGVFTNSRYGWFNEGTSDGPSEHLNREFVNALYADKENNAGVAEMLSKIKTAPWIGLADEYEPGAQRWVFYDHNALTDPSLPIWTANPLSISVSSNSDLKFAANLSVSVASKKLPIQNMTCILVQDTVIFAKNYTDANGQATIKPVFDNIHLGNATLIISGYNVLPHEYPIKIIASDTAVLAVQNIVFADGNNNIPQNNEQYKMNFDLINYGNTKATNINLSLSSKDTLIKIYKFHFYVENVDKNDTISLSNIFEVLDTCMPDQYKATLNLKISTDNYSYNREIKYTVDAATVKNSSVKFSEISGNGDKYIDADEQWNIELGFSNFGHSMAAPCTGFIFNRNNNISFANNKYTVKSILVGDTMYINYNFTVNTNVASGQKLTIKNIFNNRNYPDSLSLSFYAGKVDEDFETGDFSKFDWVNTGDAKWTIATNDVYEGSKCAKSGAIANNKKSILRINLNLLQAGNISFVRKISSEKNADYLIFTVDGHTRAQWSGNINWSVVSFSLSPGKHKLEWTYEKNNSSSAGDDYAKIDNISFPPYCEILTKLNEKIQTKNFNINVFPNPFTNKVYFKINTNKKEYCNIYIYNATGKEIYFSKNNLNKGDNIIEWNTAINKDKGIYFYKIISSSKSFSGKIIKN